MTDMIDKIIAYRIAKADEALDLAKISTERKYWNSAASRLYYTCFYLITALFAKYNITTHTHKGVKAVFGLQFIKEGKIDDKWGKLFTVLFNTRQMGDYGDFIYLTEEEIEPLIKEVEEFRAMILNLL